MTAKQKEAAELFAVGSISWEDVVWFCGPLEPETEKEMKDFATEYAAKIDSIMEFTALLCEEYDLGIQDLSTAQIINLYNIYEATGQVIY